MFTYSFTRDLNLITPRRRTLEDFLSTVIQDPSFLPRNTHQIVPLRECSVSIETF